MTTGTANIINYTL